MKNLLFLIGRIRSKEKNLLNKSDWQRLTESSDLFSFLGKLKDTAYGKQLEKADTYEAFETALNHSLQIEKDDLFSFISYPFEKLIWKKYDFHNLKLFLKMSVGFKDLRPYLVPLGNFKLEKLEAIFLHNEKIDLPKKYIKLIQTVKELYTKYQDFSIVDNYFDQEYFKELCEEAQGFGEQVADYVKYSVDFANYKIWWFRKKTGQKNIAYLLGGKLKINNFENTEIIDADLLLNKIMLDFNKEEIANEALRQKKIDDFMSDLLFRNKYQSNGLFPVLNYFQAKENEIKNLKIFYLVKAKNMESLNSLLRRDYV